MNCYDLLSKAKSNQNSSGDSFTGKDRSRFGPDSSGEDDSDDDDDGSNRSNNQSHDQVSLSIDESGRVYRQKLSLLSYL